MWQCTKSGTVAQYLWEVSMRYEESSNFENFEMCCGYVMLSHTSTEYIMSSSLELIMLVRGHDVSYKFN